jgi:pentatricopeptide repeat protein
VGKIFGHKKSAKPTTLPATQQKQEGASDAAEIPLTAAQNTLKERNFDELVRTLRDKQDEYRKRLTDLDQREKRLELAQETLKKQSLELENVRMQLVAQSAGVKEEQAKLQQSRIVVAEQERANIKKTAGIYEKMEPASCVKIIEGMCANNQMDEAVKILHYMSDRSAAKLLGEISDKAMAAKICVKLKVFTEG